MNLINNLLFTSSYALEYLELHFIFCVALHIIDEYNGILPVSF